MEDIATRLASVQDLAGAVYDQAIDPQRQLQPFGWVFTQGRIFDEEPSFTAHVSPRAFVLTNVSFLYDASSAGDTLYRVADRFERLLLAALYGNRETDAVRYSLFPTYTTAQDLAAERDQLGLLWFQWRLEYGVFVPGD